VNNIINVNRLTMVRTIPQSRKIKKRNGRGRRFLCKTCTCNYIEKTVHTSQG